jgi:hypothetical protein
MDVLKDSHVVEYGQSKRNAAGASFLITVLVCNQSTKVRSIVQLLIHPAKSVQLMEVFVKMKLSKLLVESGSLSLRTKGGPTSKFLAPHLQKSFDAKEILSCRSPQLYDSQWRSRNPALRVLRTSLLIWRILHRKVCCDRIDGNKWFSLTKLA